MSEHAVQTIDLCRQFDSTWAIKNLDLLVSRGTILAMLGPNGAGKTTLMRILMGLIDPTRGKAFVLGTPSRSAHADIAGCIAYLGDRCEPANWVTLAMLENLQAEISKAFDRALFRNFCERHELSPKQPYGSLSKGQRRWVLTSLALACRPKLILLDEPADGLDPSARRALYDAIRDHVNENNATAIITTHIIGDVERIADEVAIIDAGQLLLHAPLEDLRDSVRQVEISAGCVPPNLEKIASILGCTHRGNTSILWIRHTGLDDDGIRQQFASDVTIRHVDLSTLYLTITEDRQATEKINEGENK